MRALTQHVRIVFSLFIAFSILRGYLAFASVKMLPKKKKKSSCPKSKSEFDKEWSAKLAESDKGSFYQQEKLLQLLRVQAAPKSSLKSQMKKAN